MLRSGQDYALSACCCWGQALCDSGVIQCIRIPFPDIPVRGGDALSTTKQQVSSALNETYWYMCSDAHHPRAGDLAFMLTSAANNDPLIFKDPSAFIPGRENASTSDLRC